MKDFLLIFRSEKEFEEAFAKLSPEQMQKELENWSIWINRLAKHGNFVSGNPLLPTGRVLHAPSKRVKSGQETEGKEIVIDLLFPNLMVTDGPYTEGKNIIGGYVLIKARDMDEAVKLTQDCPQLEIPNGTVEIREIMPTAE